MSTRTQAQGWIAARRGNRSGPLERADFRWFRGLGWFLLACAAAITLVYALNLDFAAYTVFRGELRTAHGTVTLVRPTGWYEPGTPRVRRDARTEIVEVAYSFVDEHGVTRESVSYLPNVRPTVGALVTVEYPVGQPDVSRIRGYRTAKFDHVPWALGLMAGAGAIMLAVGLYGGRRFTEGGDKTDEDR